MSLAIAKTPETSGTADTAAFPSFAPGRVRAPARLEDRP